MTSDQSAPRPLSKFPIGMTVAVAIAMAIMIALGVWQIQRLHWKEGLLAHVAALHNAAPVPAAPLLAGDSDLDFRRVEIDCPGLAVAPYVELFGVREGEAGSRLISACAIDAGPYRSVLVDRGFVIGTVSARPPVDPAGAAPLHLVGVLRVPERGNWFSPANDPATRHFYLRDAAVMAKVLGAPAPAPVFLLVETPTNPEWQALVPAPLPEDIPNNHLQYVLTWFGLAAALAGVYAAVLWRRLKDQ
jgi:surfeit locus 1 family protein